MKNLLLTITLALVLFACGNNTQTVKDTSESETPEQTTDQKASKTEATTDILGLYTAGSHDQSWAVFVDEGDGSWSVKGVEIEGMLPPDNIFNYPEDITFDYFDTFDVDTEQKTFTSDWGKGRFENGQMIFEEKEGLYIDEDNQGDSGLYLSQNKQQYQASDLTGIYSGSTWHSQGYLVIIEQVDGKLVVKASETEGGTPTAEDIEQYPEDYNFTPFNTFDLNESLTSFTSDWGAGRFQEGEKGTSLIFKKLKGAFDPGSDKEDIQVRLYKVPEE